jgi:hypothetical protein
VLQRAFCVPQLAESLGRQRPLTQVKPEAQLVSSLQVGSHFPRLHSLPVPQAASVSQLVVVPGSGLTGSPATG